VPERQVRFTEQFFNRLDWLLPDERGADGAPSVTDFLLLDLPPVRDDLATNFEATTFETDDPEVRSSGMRHFRYGDAKLRTPRREEYRTYRCSRA
jgi:hypothetical protein